MKRSIICTAVAMTLAASAVPALAAGAKATEYKGEGTLSDSQVIVADPSIPVSVSITDVAQGARGDVTDRAYFNDGDGTFGLQHEALPDGRVTCYMNGYAYFLSRDTSKNQTWVEDLRNGTPATLDGNVMCYTSNTNAGKDFQVYFLTYEPADDPNGHCITVSPQDDGTYALSAPPYTPAWTETTNTGGLPLIGGGSTTVTEHPATGCKAKIWHRTDGWGRTGPTDGATLVADEVSAAFKLTFSASL